MVGGAWGQAQIDHLRSIPKPRPNYNRFTFLFRNLFRYDFFKKYSHLPLSLEYSLSKNFWLKMWLLLDKYKRVFFDSNRFATFDSEKFPRCGSRYSLSSIFLLSSVQCWITRNFSCGCGRGINTGSVLIFFQHIWIVVDQFVNPWS